MSNYDEYSLTYIFVYFRILTVLSVVYRAKYTTRTPLSVNLMYAMHLANNHFLCVFNTHKGRGLVTNKNAVHSEKTFGCESCKRSKG